MVQDDITLTFDTIEELRKVSSRYENSTGSTVALGKHLDESLF
jgi:hypothetical protein